MYNDIPCYVIVVAGGAGTRFGGDVPKQFLLLDDKPVVMHSVMQFAAIDYVDGIILVVPHDYLRHCENLAIPKVRAVVASGTSRQQSVYNGLMATDSDGLVLIHDGARPFVSKSAVDSLVQAAYQHKAATLAWLATDTIKTADEAQFARQTLCRDNLYHIQTPQAFCIKTLLDAHETGFTAGDDCELVERMGIWPKIVIGNADNIKITNGLDLDFARFLLERGSPE